MIRIVFSIDDTPISLKNEIKIKRFGVEWHIINIIASRVLMGALVKNEGRAESLKRFLMAMGYNPIMIYSLNKNGSSTGRVNFNESEYINMMPDIVIYDEEFSEVSRDRPTVFKEIHNFSGWEAITI